MSDLFTELKTGVYDRLANNAYFLGTPGIPVILEDRLDLVSEIQKRIAQIGACVVIGEPAIAHTGNHSYDVSIIVSIYERPIINRSASGSGKTGHDIALACWELLGDWSYYAAVWSPFIVRRLEPMQVSELPMVRELEIFTTGDIQNESRE